VKQRKTAIAALLAEGFPVAVVAQKLNVGVSAIYKTVRDDPDLNLRRSTFGMAHHIGRIGRISDALAREPEEFIAWVKANVPEDGTVAEFLVSCALDSYLEETDPGTPTT